MVSRASRPYFYLFPAGAILALFHLVPFFSVVWISFYRDWGKAGSLFVGLANYKEIFRQDEFVYSLGITLWYAAGTIFVTLGLSMVFAVLLRKKRFGGGVYRLIYFLPYVTSTVAAAAVWKWILHVDDKGLANAVLTALGCAPLRFTEDPRGIFELLLGHSLPLLGSGPSLALVSVMIFSVWQTFGFYVIVFSAGLAQIPKEIYEAASLDGAGSGRTFVSITLPLLRPILAFLSVISTISAFQTFNQIYIMAPSERLNTARNVTMYIVTQFWDFDRLGPASAAAVCLFALLVGLTLIQLWYYRWKEAV
jgi:multiple sugar transport system permease protein